MADQKSREERRESEADVRGEHNYRTTRTTTQGDQPDPALTRRPGDYAAGADGTQHVATDNGPAEGGPHGQSG